MVDFDIILLNGLIVLVLAGCSFAGSFVFQLFFNGSLYVRLKNRLDDVEQDLDSMATSVEMKQRSMKGVEARQEKETQVSLAMAEAIEMKKAGAASMEIITTLAPKYPLAAKEFLKKGLGGLGI